MGTILRRLGVAWGARVSLFAGLLARLVAALVFALTAVQAVERGGVWFDVLAVLMGVLAFAGLAVTGLTTWGLLRYDGDVSEE
jgi:hypothetical protein